MQKINIYYNVVPRTILNYGNCSLRIFNLAKDLFGLWFSFAKLGLRNYQWQTKKKVKNGWVYGFSIISRFYF